MEISLNSRNIKLKHVTLKSGDRVSGLVSDDAGTWKTGMNYQLVDERGNEILAELVEVKDNGRKTRLTFQK